MTEQEAVRKRHRKLKRKRKAKRMAKRMAYNILKALDDFLDKMMEFVQGSKWVLLAAVFVAIIAGTMTVACQNREKETEEEKQGTEETTQERVQEQWEELEQEEELEQYGCALYGTYEEPFNAMSQDWSGEQVEGFYYHEITEECKAAGGRFPVIAQVYTYIVCQNYGVDYEMVFALIERESKCVWTASGDNGQSIGYMQIAQKWHTGRMEKLHVTDLTNPYQNVMVGVDYLAELQGKMKGTVQDEVLNYYVLGAYNYGMTGARTNLWNHGVFKYTYNTEIMARAQQLKDETAAAKEGAEQNE